MSRLEKVTLVEKCINAEHNSNKIFNINIEELRKEYEKNHN
jgi:hypothetical protein